MMAGSHMGIVRSKEDGNEADPLYFPELSSGMAHHSYASPDGKLAVIVEMNGGGSWLPCKLVSLLGKSVKATVGPSTGACTSAAWSPDGKWIYMTANAGNGFHIWRQRTGGNQPEQFTSDPITEEEGLAMDPNGGSLITSAGVYQRAVWMHDRSGDRQISVEGFAYSPRFSSDGKKLYYTVDERMSDGLIPHELWSADLNSGHAENVWRDLRVTCFSISSDDRIIAAVRETDGKTRMWLTSIGSTTLPRKISETEGDMPVFGTHGDIFFAAEGNGVTKSLFRIREDGTNRQKIRSDGIGALQAASPDGKWVAVNFGTGGLFQLVVYSTSDGTAVPIYADVSRVSWSADGKRMYLSITADSNSFGNGRTYVLPLSGKSILPKLPPGGFRSESELAAIPGVEILPYGDVTPGPSPDTYAFSRITATRNLYRIPLR